MSMLAFIACAITGGIGVLHFMQGNQLWAALCFGFSILNFGIGISQVCSSECDCDLPRYS